MPRVVVVGAGVFGVAAAWELAERGWEVTLLDAGRIPRPEAASTDLSKLVRMDYGHDAFYADWMMEAFPRWEAWNRAQLRPLYHRDGFLLLSREPFQPGGFEHDSWQAATSRGLPTRRLATLALPAPWTRGAFADGYLNEHAGWAESGEVVAWMLSQVRRSGVRVVEGARVREFGRGWVVLQDEVLRCDRVVVAAGSWSARLVPELEGRVRAVGQPVLHLSPARPEAFATPAFWPWAADIANTGWYGFPLHPSGVVKVANHGRGVPIDPEGPREVPDAVVEEARRFLQGTLPALAQAPVVARRLCPYCDSVDGDFWIDALPSDPSVIVATGGSGHGFKFAPVLGELIAAVVEGKDHPRRGRFAWREPAVGRTEHARSQAEPLVRE
jgi:glycine/D-amino acid oxidase-like deaminating enzyme